MLLPIIAKQITSLVNDINEPFINLCDKIINYPEQLINAYHFIWNSQSGREEEYYYEAREIFNNTQKLEYLLFILAKCVKAAVRYNTQPESLTKGRIKDD